MYHLTPYRMPVTKVQINILAGMGSLTSPSPIIWFRFLYSIQSVVDGNESYSVPTYMMALITAWFAAYDPVHRISSMGASLWLMNGPDGLMIFACPYLCYLILNCRYGDDPEDSKFNHDVVLNPISVDGCRPLILNLQIRLKILL